MTASAATDAPHRLEDVTAIFAAHLPFYRRKAATYQTVMLNALAAAWGSHTNVLDIGGGTGVVAQAVHELFGCAVTTVDVANRFAPSLTIPHFTYNGQTLPFANGAFDAVTLMNVVHHIPPAARAPLFREIRRVCRGPTYIKDHLVAAPIDRARLTALDFLGNSPFSGMVEADYLAREDWTALALTAGYEFEPVASGAYRRGAFAAVFPDRLEILMRWRPV